MQIDLININKATEPWFPAVNYTFRCVNVCYSVSFLINFWENEYEAEQITKRNAKNEKRNDTVAW